MVLIHRARQAGIPPGYLFETGTVERVNGCQFRVNRAAMLDYAVGRPLVLLMGGRAVPASVHQVSYNTGDSKTYVTTNVQFSGVPAVARDESLAYTPGVDRDTALLMHFDTGTLGLDSSLNNFSVVAGGSPAVGTTSPTPKFGPQYCSLNGFSYFYCASLPGLAGSWTWEAWIYGQISTILGGGGYDWTGPSPQRFYIGLDGSYRLYTYQYSSGQSINDTFVGSAALVANQWNHVAVSRDGPTPGTFYAFINGVGGSIGTRVEPGIYAGDIQGIFCTHDYYDGSIENIAANGLNVDELRVSTVCRYKSNFTVPTLPFGPNAQ